jgi:hypothetical protein
MNSNSKTTGIDRKVLLSTLWIFALFNVIFRDIHEIFRPGFLEEVMAGSLNGLQMTEGSLLLAAILLEIPIAMLLLSWVLKYRVNRWANIVTGAATIAFVIGNGVTDLDDIFFVTMIIVALFLIVWYAWKWPNPELSLENRI